MSYESPAPPEEVSSDVVQSLEELSPESLREIARYAEELAEYRERESRLDEAGDDDIDSPDDIDDRPDDVPSKATITIKEINDNRYYYWQWREGDKIRSQYESPVDTDR